MRLGSSRKGYALKPKKGKNQNRRTMKTKGFLKFKLFGIEIRIEWKS